MSSHLHRGMLLTVVERVLLDNYVTLCLLMLLLFLLLWQFWKILKLYKEFPTFPSWLLLVYNIIMKKIPKHIPLTAFIFQHLVLLSRHFQKEGLFLLWLPKPHLLVFDESAVKAFINEPAALDKASKYEVLMDVFGSGLVTSNGETWKAHRKMLNPVFHVGIIKSKVSIFNENAKLLVKKLEDVMNDTSIDVLELLKPCTFGIICEYVFGLKMNIPENKEIIENYIKLITNGSEMMVHRFAQPWLHFKLLKKYLPSGQKYSKMIDAVNNFALEIISTMKKNIISQQANRQNAEDYWNEDSETRKSFAHILLDRHMKDNSITMEDIQSQVTTFITGGFDTVSYTLMWNLFMLGHHPEVQDHAYNEVDTISEGDIIYEELHKLKYLECVIKETLRLYPTVPMYGRKLRKDVQCGKYNVPKGTEIVFFPYMLHRNPDVYEDPEKFYPERFLEGNSEKLTGNHISFSEGLRSCIGKRFAMMEMKVILAYILRNFRITSLDRKEDVDLSWNIILCPARPLQFRFTPRKRRETISSKNLEFHSPL